LTLAEAPVNRIAPVLVGQHPLHRLLRHQKAAEGADGHRLGHIGRHQIDEHAARPATGVIDDHVGAAISRSTSPNRRSTSSDR